MNFTTISRTNLVLLLAINLIAADETDGEGFKIVFQTLKDLSEKVKDHDRLLTEKDATIKEMSQEIFKLKNIQLNPKDECSCNLTSIENDIRQNVIAIAQVRQLVVLDSVRISGNSNLIYTNIGQIDDLNTSIGNMESFPPPGRIIFSAYKAEGESFSGDVTYNTLVENVGNGVDIRSGVFNCPQSGLYMFSFSGRTRNNESTTFVEVNVNGVQDFLIGSSTTKGVLYEHISHTWLSDLKVNDKVKLEVTVGQMYSNSVQRITFNGMKIK